MPSFLSILGYVVQVALVFGELRLSNVFRDHMVLQEPNPSKGINAPFIFGEALLNETVYIEGSEGFPGPFRVVPKTNKTKNNFYGNFSIQLIPNTTHSSYPGPYTIQLYSFSNVDNTTITGQSILSDVYFGDVFLCSGQSNMELSVSSTDNKKYEYEIANTLPNVRLFHSPDTFSNYTLQNFSKSTEWQIASNTTIESFSAVCWMHGRMLAQYFEQSQSSTKKKYIGLIQSTIGGTSVYFWAPGHIGLACNITGQLPNSGECAKEGPPYYRVPGSIYNAMVNPLAMNGKGISISGVLWYQGEADSGENDNFEEEPYVCMLYGLINGWREAFNNENLMFLIIQLPNVIINPYQNINTDLGWTAIQVAQYEVWQLLAGQEMSKTNSSSNGMQRRFNVNTGLVVISDQGQNDLHYPHKIVVSQRAFYWTKWLLYGNYSGVNPFPPYVKYAKYLDDSNNLQFYIKVGNANTNPLSKEGLSLQKSQNCSKMGNATAHGTNGDFKYSCCEFDGVNTVVVRFEGIMDVDDKGHPTYKLWNDYVLPCNVTFMNDANSNDSIIIVNPILPQIGLDNWPSGDVKYLGTEKLSIRQFYIQTSNKCSVVNDYGIPLSIGGPFIVTTDVENNFENIRYYHGQLKYEL